MTPSPKNNAPLMAITAVVAGVFAFLYVYCYQTPTLTYAQHVLSGGVTVYHPLVSALLLTTVLGIVSWLVYKATKLRGRGHAMIYVPSALLLALLTTVEPDGEGGISMGLWVWAIPVILLLYVVAIRVIKQWISMPSAPAPLIASSALTVNLLTLTVLMLFVTKAGNGDELFHREVWAEKLLLERRYDLLAHEGQPCSQLRRQTGAALFSETGRASVSERTDTTLSFLRALALDKRGTIADSLFTQPVALSSGAMLHLEGVRPLIVSRRFLRRRKSRDYRLCAALASRDLDAFARYYTKCVNDSVIDVKHLPTHYSEALIAYQHLRSQPLTAYSDPAREADYRDLRDLLAKARTPNERRELLRQSYRNTFWNYLDRPTP